MVFIATAHSNTRILSRIGPGTSLYQVIGHTLGEMEENETRIKQVG